MPRPKAPGRPQNFYERVWAFVERVPSGRVVTYGQVALELGSPAAARAVGYALRVLPAETAVPWWRVINSKGGISLRGRGPQADLQRSLLGGEGIAFGSDGTTDLRRFRWWPDDDDEGDQPSLE